MSWQILAPIILGIWLLILTVAFIALLRFFRRLVAGAKGLDLRAVLDKMIVQGAVNHEQLEVLEKELRRLDEQGQLHVQKVGLIRFNPFKEIGGDHSFSLALLDAKETGVIITGLHTRERTRVYMKEVKGGKSEHELSEEERKALVKAIKS